MSDRGKELAADAALTLGATLFALAFGAAVLLFAFHKHRLPVKGLYRADPELGYDLSADLPRSVYYEGAEVGDYTVFTNDLGCYDEPFTPGSNHVLLIGDSFTQGMKFEESWGHGLQEALGERVLKCGVSGFSTKTELIKADRVMAKTGAAPRALVVGYCPNDLEEDYYYPLRTVIRGYAVTYKYMKDLKTGATAELPRESEERRIRRWEFENGAEDCPSTSAVGRAGCWLRGRAALYYSAKDRILTSRLGSRFVQRAPSNPDAASVPPFLGWIPLGTYPWVDKAWKLHLSNFTALKELARRRRAPLLVVFIPTKEQVYDFLREDMKAAHPELDPDQPNRLLAAHFKKEGVAFLDLTPVFHAYADQSKRAIDVKTDLFYRYNGHWGPKGERLGALLTAQALLEKDLVKVPGKDEKLKAIRAALAAFPR